MSRLRPADSAINRVLRWAPFLFPVILLLGFLHGPGLALAGMNRNRKVELNTWKKNVYQTAWLDSAVGALRREKNVLARMQDRVERRLLSDSLFNGAMSDSLRRQAQSFGCEVLRLTPSRESAGHLEKLRLRMEAQGDFPSALRWFESIRQTRPEAYLDEALIRPDSRGKLSIRMTFLFHTRVKP